MELAPHLGSKCLCVNYSNPMFSLALFLDLSIHILQINHYTSAVPTLPRHSPSDRLSHVSQGLPGELVPADPHADAEVRSRRVPQQ